MDVFLSHSAADRKLAERLTDSLEDRGLSVWFGDHELSPGSNWQHEIEQAIRSAKSVVLLLDRQREADDVQDFTWRAALGAAWDARKRLIPVLRRGAELPAFVLSASPGGAVPVVRLEDARTLRGVVDSIVELANGSTTRSGRSRANGDPRSAARSIVDELAEEPVSLSHADTLDAGRHKSMISLGLETGRRKQRLDEIERYARALK